MIEGSDFEDEMSLDLVRHFYDPIIDDGLAVWVLISAIDWSLHPIGMNQRMVLE